MKTILSITFGTSTGFAAIMADPHLTNVGLIAAMVIGIAGSFIVRPVEKI